MSIFTAQKHNELHQYSFHSPHLELHRSNNSWLNTNNKMQLEYDYWSNCLALNSGYVSNCRFLNDSFFEIWIEVYRFFPPFVEEYSTYMKANSPWRTPNMKPWLCCFTTHSTWTTSTAGMSRSHRRWRRLFLLSFPLILSSAVVVLVRTDVADGHAIYVWSI